MNQSYSNDSRMGAGPKYVAEVTRLQREADSFTTKYEHEKKRLLILEDSLSTAADLRKAKEIELKKERPSTAKMRKDQAECKRLENQLDKNYKDLNGLESQNRTLRKEIDVMRKEQKN